MTSRLLMECMLRVARVVLAIWWLAAPFLLGWGGTFPQRQESVLGLVLLPLMLLGLLVSGMRVTLIAGGAWLIGSALWSGMYPGMPHAVLHDQITGVIAVLLGVVPLRLLPTLDGPIEITAPRPALWLRGVRRIGVVSGIRRRTA